jgi:hypothetical protein
MTRNASRIPQSEIPLLVGPRLYMDLILGDKGAARGRRKHDGALDGLAGY